MANVQQAVEVYTQGTKAWFEDDREAWVSTTCISNTTTDGKVRIVFQSDNDERVNFDIKIRDNSGSKKSSNA